MDKLKINLEMRPRHNPRLAQQELGEKAVLLHYEGRQILGLNETGSHIWSLLDGKRSLEQVVDHLLAGNDLPREQVERDVLEFAGSLVSRDLLAVD